ncbi:DUF5993 family protein [Stappia sp.]|uniref:DUF5993 family protein n=1 Tax=Stappia sp. TaxID=1870903 RepID=UPI0025E18598|nr:DUF5993 family protein [Stappia sp.]|tara:strand:- start:958 stop:1116 length:159 start_codon:yes stop_codon:yes gene_type:complete
MYLAALFFLITLTLVVAAFGSARFAGLLTAVSFVVAVLVYLHHATDALPISL